MNKQLKKAPQLKAVLSQNKSPQEDIFILAGGNVWEYYGYKENKGKEANWLLLCDIFNMSYREIPVILDSRSLSNLSGLQIAPKEHKSIKIICTEELREEQKTAICLNLATTTQAQIVAFCNHIGEMIENASKYINSLRNDSEALEIAEKIANLNEDNEINLDASSTTENEKARAFINWYKSPLARDLKLKETLKYNGKYWEVLSIEKLKRAVISFYDEHKASYTINRINKLTELIELSIDVVPEDKNNYIGFNNAVIDKLTGEILPLDKNYYLRGVEDYDCSTSNDTPLFFDWLNFVTDDGKDKEKKNAILAGMYMILTNHYEWQLFLECTGVGGSGKSIFSEICALINGSSSTAYLSLKDLETDVNRGKLINKTLNISPDQKSYQGSADELKVITGGGEIGVKILYKSPFSIRLNPVFLLVTNNPLTFTDRNGGITRRRVIIHFNRPIPLNKKDVNFLPKIKVEIGGIIRYLLSLFPDPDVARYILENYKDNDGAKTIKRESNHLIDFAEYLEVITEENRPIPNGLYVGSNATSKKPQEAIYKAYLFYCSCYGIKEMNLKAFKSALPDALKETGQKEEIIERLYCGYPRTNIYWKRNYDEIAKEWQG